MSPKSLVLAWMVVTPSNSGKIIWFRDAQADIVIRIRWRIVQVQGENARIRFVIPIATAERGPHILQT